MAIVAGRWFTEYELVDKGGQVTRRRFEHNNPADYAAALAAETALRTDLEGVTSCVIKSVRTYQVYYEDSLSLPANAQNENQAVFVFQLADPLKTGILTVPGPEEGIFVALSGSNSNILDLADAAVVAYADNFLSGGSNLFLISDGEEPDALLKGHRRHTKKALG
jgi:hypothetical protein